MITTTLPSLSEDRLANVLDRVPWRIIALLMVIFFSTEIPLNLTSEDVVDESADFREEAASEGSMRRRMMFASLGLLGVYLLHNARNKSWGSMGVLGGVLIGLYSWCVMSFLWAPEPSLTGRRLVLLTFFVLGGLGLSRSLTLKQLMWCALGCAMTFFVVGIGVEIVCARLQPWRSTYRFGGTLHPNLQGLNCCMLFLAAWNLAKQYRNGALRTMLVSLAVTAFVFLFLTKSRSAFGALVGGQVVSWLIRSRAMTLITWGSVFACILATVGILFGDVLEEKVTDVALMGRSDREMTSSLTGRGPLWEELITFYAQDRIVTGFGFNSFWTPEHIDAVSATQGWSISESHNAYLEILLGLGLPGVLMYASAMIIGIWRTSRLDLADPSAGYGFACSLILLCALNALLESSCGVTRCVPFFAACMLAHLAFGGAPATTPTREPAFKGAAHAM